MIPNNKLNKIYDNIIQYLWLILFLNIVDIIIFCLILCDLLQYATILYTILFDEFYNIVWYCLVLDVGYNIEQYCSSILFGFVCCIVIYCKFPAGIEQSCNNFVTKSMAGLTNSCDGFAYRIEQTEEGGYVLHITNATAIIVRNAENMI